MLAELIREVGAERVGIRAVTGNAFERHLRQQPLTLHAPDAAHRPTAPVYIHVVEGATGGDRNFGAPFDYALLRRNFRGTYIANNGYDIATAEGAVAGGRTDLVAFGKAFLANPDLVARLASVRRSMHPTRRPSTAEVPGATPTIRH